MFVRALWKASQRFCCFMSNEAGTEVTVGLSPSSLAVGGGDCGTLKYLLRKSAQQLHVTILRP